MNFSHTTLAALLREADEAYQEARWKVWDQLVPGQPLDVAALTAPQRAALRSLAHAEAAVATYREFVYVTSRFEDDEMSLR